MLQPGQIIDRYEVEAVLGQGGLARVYRVRHRALGSVHALKLLTLPGSRVGRRLLREGRIQARLVHPHIVAVSDVVEHDGKAGLLMEFVEGWSLEEALNTRGALPLDEALGLFRQVLAGVAAAHDAGVLHRDLKPGNILLQPTTGGVLAKVTDFGIAKWLLDGEEGTGGDTLQSDLLGTPGYMAPEQANDPSAVDARADIFSLGVLLYGMVTGRPPFGRGSLGDLLARAEAGAFPAVRVVAPAVPEPVAQAIERCLNPFPAERFPDCRALAEAIYGDAALPGAAEPPQAVRFTLSAPAPTPRDPTAGGPVSGGASGAASASGSAGSTLVPGFTVDLSAAGPSGPDATTADGPAVAASRGGGRGARVAAGAVVLLGAGLALWALRGGDGPPAPGPAAPAVEAAAPPSDASAPPGGSVGAAEAPAPEGAPAPGPDGAVAGGTIAAPVAEARPARPGPEAPGAASQAGPAAAPAGAQPSPEAIADARVSDDGPPSAASTAAPEPPRAPDPPPAAAPPEAPPPAPPAVAGTWQGRLDGRALLVRIEGGGARVRASFQVQQGGNSIQRVELVGAVGDDGRLRLAEEDGAGWVLEAQVQGGSLVGTARNGPRSRPQAWTARME